MKVLAFAGSNSSKSINHQLIEYVATLNPAIEVIKLTDYPAPTYGIDHEENEGIPPSILALDQKIMGFDHLIVSAAEHNAGMTAFFKSHLDWLSRNNLKFLDGKKVIVLGTSTGRGGASKSIEQASLTLPRFGAEVVDQVSLPSFNHSFVHGKPLDDQFIINVGIALAKL